MNNNDEYNHQIVRTGLQVSKIDDRSGIDNTIQKVDYHLIERIGEGQYGVVYKAVHKQTFQVFACKKMNLRLIEEKNCMNDLQNEIKNLHKVNHPNIVKLVEEIKSINHHYLFFEYCNGGTLSEIKEHTEILSEGVVRSIGIQLLQAIKFLHSINIVHRDIKGANIMLHFPDLERDLALNPGMSRENRKRRIVELLYKQRFLLKIVDFGFSKQLNFLEEEIFTNCGTPLNMAPEIMNNRPYNYKADLWSIGVQIFLLLTGSYPFIANTKEGLIEKIDIGLYQINRQLKITPYCLDFLNKMLQYEPSRRMDWQQISVHPFYNHKQYYKYLEKLSFAVSYEDGNCHVLEIPNKISRNIDQHQKNNENESSVNKSSKKNKSIAAHQLSEIMINCQNSHLLIISADIRFDSHQRYAEKERKLQKIKQNNKLKKTNLLQKFGSEVLINADAMNVKNLINQVPNIDYHIAQGRDISFFMLSDCNYIDDTDECINKQNSPQFNMEPLSNFQRLQTKGKASSYSLAYSNEMYQDEQSESYDAGRGSSSIKKDSDNKDESDGGELEFNDEFEDLPPNNTLVGKLGRQAYRFKISGLMLPIMTNDSSQENQLMSSFERQSQKNEHMTLNVNLQHTSSNLPVQHIPSHVQTLFNLQRANTNNHLKDSNTSSLSSVQKGIPMMRGQYKPSTFHNLKKQKTDKLQSEKQKNYNNNQTQEEFAADQFEEEKSLSPNRILSNLNQNIGVISLQQIIDTEQNNHAQTMISMKKKEGSLGGGRPGRVGQFAEASPLNVIEEEDEVFESQRIVPQIKFGGSIAMKQNKSPFRGQQIKQAQQEPSQKSLQINNNNFKESSSSTPPQGKSNNNGDKSGKPLNDNILEIAHRNKTSSSEENKNKSKQSGDSVDQNSNNTPPQHNAVNNQNVIPFGNSSS